ncbi:MAG TPA: GNAT family N-acetyltransferase [Puia sp.]|jgi:ribosomal-protein-alanine N-acetyltransferase
MVETNRLNIIPLNSEQLELYLQGDNKFEKEFKLVDSGRKVSPEIKERVLRTILPAVKNSSDKNYLFYTFWIVIEISKNIIVAELGFKGEPAKNGEIEIGYGTLYEHRENGYMTEAVNGIINWAKQQQRVKYILAETDENNLASISVLKKNKFQFDYQKEKMKWWRIAVS